MVTTLASPFEHTFRPFGSDPLMSYEIYKLLHLVGIFLLFLSYGMALRPALAGGDAAAPGRGFVAAGHGLGLLLLLVAGFGMMARLGISTPWPAWIWVKVGIWLVMALGLTVVKRAPALAKLAWLAVLALGVVSAWAAVFKPGA